MDKAEAQSPTKERTVAESTNTSSKARGSRKGAADRLEVGIQFRVTAEQAERLRRAAALSRRSPSNFMRVALEDALDALGVA